LSYTLKGSKRNVIYQSFQYYENQLIISRRFRKVKNAKETQSFNYQSIMSLRALRQT